MRLYSCDCGNPKCHEAFSTSPTPAPTKTKPKPTGFGSKEPTALRVRLAQTFRTPNQGMLDIMGDVRRLTPADLADFNRWYNELGYVTSYKMEY